MYRRKLKYFEIAKKQDDVLSIQELRYCWDSRASIYSVCAVNNGVAVCECDKWCLLAMKWKSRCKAPEEGLSFWRRNRGAACVTGHKSYIFKKVDFLGHIFIAENVAIISRTLTYLSLQATDFVRLRITLVKDFRCHWFWYHLKARMRRMWIIATYTTSCSEDAAEYWSIINFRCH